MTPEILKKICDHFNLGTQINTPVPVAGGFLHTMWRLDTNRGSFAIKQMAERIQVTSPDVQDDFNRTEEIAARFAENTVPALGAIAVNNTYLAVIEEMGFLVYPWVEAKALSGHIPSEHHALQIANILARMHQTPMGVKNIPTPKYDPPNGEEIRLKIQSFIQNGLPNAAVLESQQDTFIATSAAYEQFKPILQAHSVATHNDLDPKNVLWDKAGNPHIIDWECACYINPMYDIVNVALDWSGIIGNDFNPEIFTKMLETYQSAGGVITPTNLQGCFIAAQANWLNWIFHNADQYCSGANVDRQGEYLQQIEQTLGTISRIQSLAKTLGLVNFKVGFAFE